MVRFRPKATAFAAVLLVAACDSNIAGPDADRTRIPSPHGTMRSELDLVVGETSQLASRNGPRVTWASQDAGIATVTDAGLVSAVKSGETLIIGRSERGADTVAVSVQSAAGVQFVAHAITLPVGQTATIAFERINPGFSSPTTRRPSPAWSTTDSSVITVDSAGVITGVAVGEASVIVRVDQQADTARVKVVDRVIASIAIESAQPVKVQTTRSYQMSALASDSTGEPLADRVFSWSSGDSTIAAVSSKGMVTGVRPGNTTVNVSSEGKWAAAKVEVTLSPDAPVATVTVTLPSSTLSVGQASQAIAVARDAAGTVLTGRAVEWTTPAPSLVSLNPTGLVTALAVGSTTVRATVQSKSADVAVAVVAAAMPAAPLAPNAPAGSAALPAVYLNTSVASTPSNGRTTHVGAGEDLQAALFAALPGDLVTLACGATFTGNFLLPAKAGTSADSWITVASECAAPAEGTRTSPSGQFTKIMSPNILPAIATNGAANHWRLVGLEVTADPSIRVNQGLIALGCPSNCETTPSDVPSDIIIDRSYVHGNAGLDLKRCIGFNAARLAVIDSYVSMCTSSFDAQAVSGWNGPGPFKIANNYLEASTENIAFGGSTPTISGLVPSDIEIRGNRIMKPMSWKNGSWLIKNLVEIKAARRVLIEGNVMENSWPQGQAGFAFVLWAANSGCSWCATEDITVRGNVIRNVSGAFNLAARYDGSTPPMQRVTISNNAVLGIDDASVRGNGRVFQLSDVIADLTIEHNTAFSPSNSSFIWGGVMPNPNHIVRNNLVGGGQYQVFSTYGQGQTAWDHVAGSGSQFAGNVVAMFSGPTIANNYFPETLDAVGLVGGANAAYGAAVMLDQLSLSGLSPYRGKATDGTDPGADISALSVAAANAIGGIGRP